MFNSVIECRHWWNTFEHTPISQQKPHQQREGFRRAPYAADHRQVEKFRSVLRADYRGKQMVHRQVEKFRSVLRTGYRDRQMDRQISSEDKAEVVLRVSGMVWLVCYVANTWSNPCLELPGLLPCWLHPGWAVTWEKRQVRCCLGGLYPAGDARLVCGANGGVWVHWGVMTFDKP